MEAFSGRILPRNDDQRGGSAGEQDIFSGQQGSGDNDHVPDRPVDEGPYPPGKDGTPLRIKDAPTTPVGTEPEAAPATPSPAPAAQPPGPTDPVDPAAPVAATDPAAAAGPKADPLEIDALEMILADPANKEMVEKFGGELQPLPTWTTVGQGIEARYGADLGGRLYQLQQAQRAVEGEFFQAMDQAQQDAPSVAAPAAPRSGEPIPISDKPGWVYQAGSGFSDDESPAWKFDPSAFAAHYAAGDSPAQRAFASLHGSGPIQFVPAADTELVSQDSWQMSGVTVRLGRRKEHDEGQVPNTSEVKDGWVPSGFERRDFHLDPNRITKLIDNEFVWFDPVQGFMTEPANLKESGIDKAFLVVMGAAFAAIGGLAVGAAIGAPTSAAGVVLQGAAVGATGSALNQYVSTGHINFKSVLTSALAGGMAAGVMQLPGVGENLRGATSPFGKLLQLTGKATLQGAIQEVIGGKFKDGFVNSMLAGVAEEVTGWINTEISNTPGLSESQASAFRLLSRATGSAIRMVGSGDPTGAASDFLAGVLGDALPSEVAAPEPEPKPSDSPYGLTQGDDGLGLRPGANGQGVRWDGLVGADPGEPSIATRPVYDFDPDGEWNPDSLNPVNDLDRPLAFFPGAVAPGAGGGVMAGGGYQAVRPNGAGGPPGYDPVYDLPTAAPGYPSANPSQGFKVPPFEIVVPSLLSNLILGPTLIASNWANNILSSVGIETGTTDRLVRGQENTLTFPDVNAAREAARRFSGLGADAVDFVQEIGPNRGLVSGRASPDGLQGWRLDWSEASGFHINWWDRRGGPSNRRDWLYGSNRIQGGTQDDYRDLFQHFPKR